MLSQHTLDQITALSSLCMHTLESELDIEAITLAVSEQAKSLLTQRVNSLNGDEPAALYGWIEHQALQMEINLWLAQLGFDGLGTNGIAAEHQQHFLAGLIQLGLPESALTCIGRGQQNEEEQQDKSQPQASVATAQYNALELLRGKALSALGQPEAAISCYLAMSLRQPEDYAPYFHLAGEYLRLGRHADALHAFDQVIERNPTLPGPWHNKGVCLYQLEDFENAIPCFEQACDLSPEFAGSWIALGKCHLSLDNTNEAWRILQHALTLGDAHPELHKTLGLTAKAMDQQAIAADYLNQALESMPDEVGLYLARAECLVSIEQYQTALNDLLRLKVIEPYNVRSSALEFECLFALKRYAEAERCYYFLQGMHPQATAPYADAIKTIHQQVKIMTQPVMESESEHKEVDSCA